MDPSDQAIALPLTRSQATNEMEQSAEARATTESQPTDNVKMQPLNKEQYDHIERFHNSWSGHRGVDATVAMLKDEGVTWKGMSKDVKQFINQCPICQKTNSHVLVIIRIYLLLHQAFHTKDSILIRLLREHLMIMVIIS